MTPELQKKCIDTIRFLAVDAVEKANSGHPGMPMGAAPMAFALWTRHLRFNPNEPRWANRDRFVLSAGHGSMLLYAMLHLAGFDVTMDDLKSFRQYGSKTPGHPEFHDTPGVEATTGPLGQGISNAVGMALSQRMLAARMNAGGRFPIDNFVYGICSDGDLMEGVASEASSVAGHLKLGNLIFLYDDNDISLAGPTSVTFTEDRGKRFEAYGWHVQHVPDGNDVEAIDRAIRAAKDDPRPSLIDVKTVIGYGSPHKANTHEVHGSPLGKDEAKAAKQNLGWPLEPLFLVPDEVRQFWAGRIEEQKKGYEDWQRRFTEWQRGNPQNAKLWSALAAQQLPEDLPEQLAAAVATATAPESTRKHGQAVIQKAAKLVPGLVGGSADLDPSTFTYVKDGGDVQPGSYGGRNIHFGVREHGMGAIVNGFAYDGFFVPYSATFLLFSDYMRPPIRLAALSKLHSVFVFTHDSIFLGEDGPTHQPIEQLAALRAIPNLEVWRPADGVETAASWAAALERKDGPTVLAFTRQKLSVLQRNPPADVRLALRGAYAVVDAQDPDLVIIATGSEVSAAQQALPLLDKSLKVRLVSMPCVERFLKWSGDEQRKLIPHGRARLVAVEAAGGLDWYRIIGDGLMVGIDRFGASAPEKALADAYGMTPQKVAGRISKWLAEGARTNAK
ncbi:MAG: transketolase [Deltaproteobacteria bacterium]|nr:MAG: transketolase [Deltaproteobacteria bacterium]